MAGDRAEHRERERAIALAWAPAAARPALVGLLALDAALGRMLRTTSEPMVGQMRLAWWRESLVALDGAPPPAEPVLAMAAAELLPRGISGTMLSSMVDGWEALLAGPLDDCVLATLAAARGGGLFRAAAEALGASDGASVIAGEGWALADLALNISDASVADRARTMAGKRFALAFARRWPVRLRPLGALALLARADLAGVPPGAPRRTMRLLGHRLTGL